jgi:hypothetical protein
MESGARGLCRGRLGPSGGGAGEVADVGVVVARGASPLRVRAWGGRRLEMKGRREEGPGWGRWPAGPDGSARFSRSPLFYSFFFSYSFAY